MKCTSTVKWMAGFVKNINGDACCLRAVIFDRLTDDGTVEECIDLAATNNCRNCLRFALSMRDMEQERRDDLFYRKDGTMREVALVWR